MVGIATFEQLKDRLRAEGVRIAYVKRLAKKQDNEKNQIVLAGELSRVIHLFPGNIVARSASTSSRKRKSVAGQPKLEARIDFAWLDAEGARHQAPETRLIDYFQYPEVRMSGFVNRCRRAPDSIRRNKLGDFGERILVLGVAGDGVVVGFVLTGRDDPLVLKFPDLAPAYKGALLRVLVVDGEVGIDPADLLRREMMAIIRGGWHSSSINRRGTVSEFRGAQGGGYTLEALLGVAANGDKKPDRHGFEIKSYSSSRISLMTPTPDRGFQGTHTFREFMERYARPGDKDPGTRRFVGTHRCGHQNSRTGLELRLTGYDSTSDHFAGPGEVGVEIIDPRNGEVAAAWSLEKLANCWNAKHTRALYIAVEARENENGSKQYRFAPSWVQGEGTDVFRLLRAIHRGMVFYDPADTVYADGTTKNRPQWRLNTRDLKVAMNILYAESVTVTV